MQPDYYMVVNFYGMEDIIDSLGGVDVKVEKNELEWLNININEINRKTRPARWPISTRRASCT